MTVWLVCVVLLAAASVLVAQRCYQTANRLDRLHVRYDLSWQALDAALARRAVVARAVAAEIGDDPARRTRLVALADHAERAQRPSREAAENELSAALAVVDPAALRPAILAELADAEARVLLARRFHNDAVRDTLALRERRSVRWLRLGGTAARPAYFEIAERAESSSYEEKVSAAHPRVSARVVLLDEDGAVLLLCGSDPAQAADTAPRWWFTVGGATQPGETLAQTAAREVGEETGLCVDPAGLRGPLWQRDAVFEFNGAPLRSREMFFVHRTRRFDPSTVGHSALERRYLHGWRWCDDAALAELDAAGEPVYPEQLAELLGEAGRIADGPPPDAAPEPLPIR